MRPGAAVCHALLLGIAFWCPVPTRAEQTAEPPILQPVRDVAQQTPARAAGRTTILLPLPVQPGWQDMAFLAAIPAATAVNHGASSLIALDDKAMVELLKNK